MLDTSLAVTTGEGVGFTFVVTNVGTEPIELTFRNSGRADFIVYEDDEEIWRWSDGQMFAQVIQSARLEPGEELSFEESGPDLEPGEYTAEATLRIRDHDVSERTTFRM